MTKLGLWSMSRSVLLLCLTVVMAGHAPASAQNDEETDEGRYRVCLAGLRTSPAAQLDAAIAWYSDGGGAAALHCQALARFALGDYEAAARALETLAEGVRLGEGLAVFAASRRELLIGQLYGQAGAAWLVAGVYDKAHSALSAALAEVKTGDVAAVDLLVDRAITSGKRREYDLALADLDRAIELAPRRLDIYLLRAKAYRARQQFDAALGDISHILALRPDDAATLVERGVIYRLTGDKALALADWQQVIDLYPDTEQAKEAAEKIKLTPY